MPLSEDEQRILRQIEEQLQRDPSFGRDIKPRRVGSRRAVVVSSIATVVCLVLTILLLAVSPYLSFVAFVGAVAALVIAERHERFGEDVTGAVGADLTLLHRLEQCGLRLR